MKNIQFLKVSAIVDTKTSVFTVFQSSAKTLLLRRFLHSFVQLAKTPRKSMVFDQFSIVLPLRGLSGQVSPD